MTGGTHNALVGTPVGPLEQDVPCKQCGYDLRGLTPPGRCPECGFDLGESVREHSLRLARKAPLDPKWAREIREGAWLSVAVFGLVSFAVLAPARWHDLPYRDAPIWTTPGRIIFLAIACGWWALTWASAWKLTTIEPRPERRAATRRWAWGQRIIASAYALGPCWWAATDFSRLRPYYPPRDFLDALMAVGIASGFLLLVRVGQLMRRCGRPGMMVEAWILALVVSFGVLYAAGIADNGPSSLTLMFDLSVHPYGMPRLYVELVDILPKRPRHSVIWSYLVLPLWSLSLMLRLAWLYRAGVGRKSVTVHAV